MNDAQRSLQSLSRHLGQPNSSPSGTIQANLNDPETRLKADVVH